MKDTDRANLIFSLERVMHKLEALQATMDLIYPSVIELLDEGNNG
tara:strand:+ start:412 stop:546 length:135 start_codon:yes stop_codon:yes gene_type:complete